MLYQIFILNLIISFFINLSYQTTIYQGDATVYGGKFYGGSCGFKNIWTNNIKNFNNYGVAINAPQYSNSLSCGKCVNIQYNNRNINALIVDICPECKYGDLDLFTEAYNDLIQESPGRKQISWKFIDCPNNIVENNIQLRIDEINYYWLSIQPENFKCGIQSMQIFNNNQWINMERNDNKMMGLYFNYHSKVNIPFKLKITSMYNEELITNDLFEINNLIQLNKQFSCNNQEKININQSINPSSKPNISPAEVIITPTANTPYLRYENIICD